jgi:hypothetical protein
VTESKKPKKPRDDRFVWKEGDVKIISDPGRPGVRRVKGRGDRPDAGRDDEGERKTPTSRPGGS